MGWLIFVLVGAAACLLSPFLAADTRDGRDWQWRPDGGRGHARIADPSAGPDGRVRPMSGSPVVLALRRGLRGRLRRRSMAVQPSTTPEQVRFQRSTHTRTEEERPQWTPAATRKVPSPRTSSEDSALRRPRP